MEDVGTLSFASSCRTESTANPSTPGRQPGPKPKSQADTERQLFAGRECRATVVLSVQGGFKGTRSRLQEIVEDAYLSNVPLRTPTAGSISHKPRRYSVSGHGPGTSTRSPAVVYSRAPRLLSLQRRGTNAPRTTLYSVLSLWEY